MAVRILLGILYGLVRLKRVLIASARVVAIPLGVVGRFLLKTVGVPVYRAFFFVKRHADRLLLPAKNQTLSFVSNRYAVHVAVIAIAAVTGTANLQSGSVRAESFGSQSMLYALVAQDDSSSVEVVTSDSAAPSPKSISYVDTSGTVDARVHTDVDFHALGEDYVTTTTGGSAVVSPTIGDGPTTVAARAETINYTIENGDTLYGVSAKFGLSLSTVLWANDLTFRSTIKPGQTLRIPATDGVLHKVKKGDTVSSIAKLYGSDTAKVIAGNRLASADDLKIGEELIVPEGEPPAPVVTRRPAPVATLFTPPAGTSTSKTGQVVIEAPPEQVVHTSRGSVKGRGNWIWPTDWRVITQYYGWRHTGIDVDGDYTTHSYAAADGVVIYAGWRTGYGMTIELDHGDGLKTRYAHHSKLYVEVGDTVKSGDLLAQTGTTGRSTGTHLHFEVIKNGKFQNPLDYIR